MKQRATRLIIGLVLAVSVFLCRGTGIVAEAQSVSSLSATAYAYWGNNQADEIAYGSGTVPFDLEAHPHLANQSLWYRVNAHSSNVIVPQGSTIRCTVAFYMHNGGQTDLPGSSVHVFKLLDNTSPDSGVFTGTLSGNYVFAPSSILTRYEDYTYSVGGKTHVGTYYVVDYECKVGANVEFDANVTIYSSYGIDACVITMRSASYVTQEGQVIEIIDSQTSQIVQNQNQNTQQIIQNQNQIAQQQQQQQQQQHEDLKNGFKDDGFNSAVSGADGSVQDYIDKESQLMGDQQNQVSDFASKYFNTSIINSYMPAVMSVSTWYSQIWNSFGEFNSAFVVILSLGVACFIVGLRRRG